MAAAQYQFSTEAPATTVPVPTTTALFETVQPTPKPTKNPYGGGDKTTKKPKTKTTTTTKKNKTKYTTTTKKNKTKTTTAPNTKNPYGGGDGNGGNGGNGNGGNGAGSAGAYGDPHFHIVGVSATQPDLCFDYNGQPGSKITLLEDTETGITAVGELFKPDEEEKGIYFKSITLTR